MSSFKGLFVSWQQKKGKEKNYVDNEKSLGKRSFNQNNRKNQRVQSTTMQITSDVCISCY